MTRKVGLPPTVRAALQSPGGKCYRHCDRPIRTRRLSSRLPGTWQVRACPSGVVSVTTYTEGTRGDPAAKVRSVLRRWAVPPTLVRSWDLRIATRHGPELGRSAEGMGPSVGYSSVFAGPTRPRCSAPHPPRPKPGVARLALAGVGREPLGSGNGRSIGWAGT